MAKFNTEQQAALRKLQSATNVAYLATQEMVEALKEIQAGAEGLGPEHIALTHLYIKTLTADVLKVNMPDVVKEAMKGVLGLLPRSPVHLAPTLVEGIPTPSTLYKPTESSSYEFTPEGKDRWQETIQLLLANGLTDCLRKQLTASAFTKAPIASQRAVIDKGLVETVTDYKWSVTKQKV